jgi:hypothetical protein
MTNELTRAWEMLTPEQRPVGMVMATGNDGTSMFGDYQEERGHIKMSDAAAHDRLCKVVEGVNLIGHGSTLMHGIDGKYHWGNWYGCEWVDDAKPDYDRLTAANNALEAAKP